MITRVLQELDPTRWQEHLFGLPPERWASLKGKSFWITGAGTGYGRALACALAAAGGQVFLTGRRRHKLWESLEELSALKISPDQCHLVEADITVQGDIIRACSQVKELSRGLHGLINNAALPSRPGSRRPLQEDPRDYWEKMVATNVTAPWLITREIFPHMLASGQVRVLFVTSGAGWAATPGYGLYNVSKAALNSLAHSLAQEYAHSYPGEDIQINALDPGEARTEMNQGSTQSPYAVVSMALILLSHPRGGPNGRFFHRDGRHLQFGATGAYPRPLIGAGRERAIPSSGQVGSGEAGAGEPPPVLVEEGYHGYNLVFYNSYYHAVSQDLGPMDLQQLTLAEFYRLQRDKKLLVSSSRSGIINRIREEVLRPKKSIFSVVGSKLLKVIQRVDQAAYPVKIPPIAFRPHQDLILLELPPRYMPMMPNGLAYVHNILKTTGIRFQTMDLNIILYHRFHSRRRQEGHQQHIFPPGEVLPEDPWDLVNAEKWNRPEIVAYFRPQIEEIIRALIEVRPRIIGISLNGLNLTVAAEVVKGVRAGLPEVVILVGGHSCVYPTVGPWLFPHFDYMVIGEAELTLGPLVKKLLAGERPKDLPGVISRHDSPGRIWEPGPFLRDLDSIDFPRYDWVDLNVYRTYNGASLTPITASRGCRWSRCNFCGERFAWRRRSPLQVADEIEWFATQGFNAFHFNESDANGDPEALLAICREVVKRQLKVSFTAQLRIDRRSDRDFFAQLRAAGFHHLRFGVDGWSDRTLRLQRKGYTISMVDQNLRYCHEAGIRTTVNIVVGVPGETEEDVKESIANLIRNKDYIDQVEGINTLILAHGSEYYNHPERYNIHFRGDKQEIYEKHRTAIPASLWYSTEPYIDQEIRVKRMKSIFEALHQAGMETAPYVDFTVDKREGELKAALQK